MSVKAICINGYWTVRANWRKRRCSHRVTPNTEERAIAVADSFRVALQLYGADAFAMFDQAEEKPDEPVSVKVFAERWLDELGKSDLKLSTRKMYASNLKHHVIPALGGLSIKEIDYAKLKAFLLSKRESSYSTGRFRNTEKKRKYAAKAETRTYSRDTLRIMVMTLRAMFSEAVREGLLKENPVRDLAQFYRLKKKDRTITRSDIYTLEDLYRIEDQLKNRTLFADDYELAVMLSRTGMRIGEARGLQLDDIDWNEKQIHISRNIPSGTNQPEDSTKTQAGERMIEMSDELVAVLGALKRRRTEKGMKEGKRNSASLFPARYEEFARNWRRAQAMAQIRYRSPHSIRHTYASQMLAAGCDIAWLSKQLGHSSPAVTLAIYSHFVPGRNNQSINAMDRKNANKMQTRLE
jgi:integrase